MGRQGPGVLPQPSLSSPYPIRALAGLPTYAFHILPAGPNMFRSHMTWAQVPPSPVTDCGALGEVRYCLPQSPYLPYEYGDCLFLIGL